MTEQIMASRFIPKFWYAIANPHASIESDNQQRNARLISGLAFGLIFVLLFGAIAAIARQESSNAITLVTLFMIPIYLLSRTRYSNLSGLLMLIALTYPSFSFFISIGTSNIDTSLYAGTLWIALPVVVGGLILPLRYSTLMNAFILSALIILKIWLGPELDTEPFWHSFSFLFILALVMTFTLQVREVYLVQPQIDKLLRANSVKDEFLATMSHELRTPLNSIIGYSSILLNGIGGEIDDDAVKYLEKIAYSGDSLLALITDILDISKIESGEVRVNLEEVSLQTLHEGWLHTFTPLAENKNIDFDITFISDFAKNIRTDATRLTQIITNLVTNAIKFTDQGHVFVKINQHRSKLVITVEDTGLGIPENELDTIFDKFKQVDSSYNRRYEGTGLGLAITKRLVELFEGTITVESIPNQGSTFTVTLPI